MFDFVSIIFDNDTEINLLKVQLFSFTFVNLNIINQIYILFNDAQNKNSTFMEKYNNDIMQFCPISLREKIKVIFISDLINLNEKKFKTSWFSQQFVKLYISKIIKSKYYIVLDSKNHFIRNINKDTFMVEDKIILYYAVHNAKLLDYYKNCFTYFGIQCLDDYNPYKSPLHIQTTTPFMFITKECIDLISYVEAKENVEFYDFFCYSQKYPEFFFYFAWLCFIKRQNNEYIYIKRHIDNIIIGKADPNTCIWNTWNHKQNIINTCNPSLFSLSRKCVSVIDNSYKQNIKDFYNRIYNNKLINNEINKILFNCPILE